MATAATTACSRSSSPNQLAAEQHYDGNTPILVTTLRDASGGAIEIRDFAPRYLNHGRFYRPTMMVRRVRPLTGEPRIRIVLRPRCDYGAGRPATTRGSNHLRYVTPSLTLRLTTDAPISYVADATPFVLQRPLSMILGPDEPLAASIENSARDLEERTHDHWVEWVRSLSIPFEWQDAVIRAAIALKLCSFEETGAIVAALTTSIPEAPGSGRNWDYRYCWLRDAYFVIQALNRLGATRTMENFLSYISNLAATADDGGLQPLYGIGLEEALEESEAPALKGFRGMGPVRVGNQAFCQLQNDIYGSVVLAATQSFFDRRLLHPAGDSLFRMLETIGDYALRLWNRPDAGLWEFRTRKQVHTFSAVMCWAACDRLARIAAHLGRAERAQHWITPGAGDPRRRCSRGPGAMRAAAWSARSTAESSMPRCSCSPSSASCPPTIRASSPRWPRSSASCGAATISTAMRTTSSARRRPPSTCARSGTSTRSRWSGGATRRARCSRTC